MAKSRSKQRRAAATLAAAASSAPGQAAAQGLDDTDPDERLLDLDDGSPPATPGRRRRGSTFLEPLGIVGWRRLEPAILAALATEEPLLLIGEHGTAKTLLLNRLAEALGLAHRHYNASLLSFDDLVGFPVPEDGRIRYLQTPATIWDAESVLFDEVSRCRPEVQNKLFPIVHERRVQGLELPRLRHRWAAMNPPPAVDGVDDGGEYAGAEPLDVALADRFAFVLHAPAFAELGRREQLQILRRRGSARDDAAGALREALARAREALPRAEATLGDAAAEYAALVAGRLAQAGHPLSTRRAVRLAANVAALAASLAALGDGDDREAPFLLALQGSLPDAAWGAPVDSTTLHAVHRVAWDVASRSLGDPMRAVLTEPDPARRAALALDPALDPVEAGQAIADAVSQLPRPQRLAVGAALMPALTLRPDLPAATLELIATEYASVARTGSEQVTVRQGGADWKRELVSSQLAGLADDSERSGALRNVAIGLAAAEERFELAQVARAWDGAREALREVWRRRR